MAFRPKLRQAKALIIVSAVVSFAHVSMATMAAGQDVDVPEVPVISVSPKSGSSDSVTPDWDQPKRPPALTGRERQALLQQVAGGGDGGLPMMNNIQTQGRTPTLRQAILTVKRPWYIHRAFLAAEGVQRVDARSILRFDDSQAGRAIVGLNLIEGHTYLIDFLLKGKGEGDYEVTTSTGTHAYPDPGAKRNHVLIALEAAASGWTEVSLRRTGGGFDLHSVEVTLARGANEEESAD